MEKIVLNDILKIDSETLKNVKIRLLTTPSNDKNNDPLEHYLCNYEKIATEWFLWKQEGQGRPFLKDQIGIGLLNLNKDKWLLVTIKKISKELDNDNSGVYYEADELLEYKKYFGRLVIKYHNSVQQMIRNADGLIDELEVLEILSTPYDGDDFPGYENVIISWKNLKIIIDRQKKDWINSLRYKKGIYLITDNKNGKQYVGSASGEDMILQRWTNYIKDGHGGDVELIEIIKENGIEYAENNFQFSILENYDKNTPKEYIDSRENWWKKALRSREHGYNKN